MRAMIKGEEWKDTEDARKEGRQATIGAAAGRGILHGFLHADYRAAQARWREKSAAKSPPSLRAAPPPTDPRHAPRDPATRSPAPPRPVSSSKGPRKSEYPAPHPRRPRIATESPEEVSGRMPFDNRCAFMRKIPAREVGMSHCRPGGSGRGFAPTRNPILLLIRWTRH